MSSKNVQMRVHSHLCSKSNQVKSQAHENKQKAKKWRDERTQLRKRIFRRKVNDGFRCWLSSYETEKIISFLAFLNFQFYKSSSFHKIPLNLFYFSIKLHWQHHPCCMVSWAELTLNRIECSSSSPFQCFPCFLWIILSTQKVRVSSFIFFIYWKL